jgi:hypothetical protein
MIKIFSLVLALALVSIITVAGTATASAKGKHKELLSFSTDLYVTGLPDVDTNFNSGWSTIDEENLAGLSLISDSVGPVDLNGMYLTAQQSSHEQFTVPTFLPATNVKKGKSKGAFYLSSYPGGPVQVVGEYQLKVSTIPGCQIYGEGKWKSKAKNSVIAGHGKITVCTNFVFENSPVGVPTFISHVEVNGKAVAVD